jgi:hypothetical protein
MLALEKIGQLERDPHLETTIRARLNAKHIHERIRVVEQTAGKNSETVRWRDISRGVMVGPDTVNIFGRVGCGKPCTSMKAITILLEFLRLMIWLDIYVENTTKGYTHWNDREHLCWNGFCNSHIPMQMHYWVLREGEVSLSEGNSIARISPTGGMG